MNAALVYPDPASYQTTAGTGALIAVWVLGRRYEFGESEEAFAPSNVPMAALGGGLLWMGWFGFNAGSVLTASVSTINVIANTQLAACSCMLVWVGLSWYVLPARCMHCVVDVRTSPCQVFKLRLPFVLWSAALCRN